MISTNRVRRLQREGGRQLGLSVVLLLGMMTAGMQAQQEGATANPAEHAFPSPQPLPEIPLEPFVESPSAIISLSAGWLRTTALNDFPSLLVGNSLAGSGIIPGEYGAAGFGHRIELEGLIYFTDAVGMTLGFGSTRSAAEYDGDSTLLPTILQLQEVEFLLGGHADLFGNAHRKTAGFRAFYLEGGFEFGLGVIGNRVTSSSVADTTTAVRTKAEGSFEGGDPFRSRVALRIGAGTTIDITGNYKGQGLSLVTEINYSLGLNPVFSSDVIENSNFKMNNLILQAGLGYRF